MFNNAQHITTMETPKNTLRILSAIALVTMLTACSSYNNVPGDDVYYSSKSRPVEANTPSATAVASEATPASSDGQFDYSTQYESNVAASSDNTRNQTDEGDYEFVDSNYESDYAARIRRFNGSGQSDDYYDEQYTSNCGGCGNYNSSFSMGVGVGMGMGYSMSYGYGWPSYSYWGYPYSGWGYPYYGWGYPHYGWGYPYYGGGYWAGYNQGYWNGYYDGYYGGGYGGYYGGGYYPEYGNDVHYGSRGRGVGGTTIPGRGGRRSGDAVNPGSRKSPETVVAGSGALLTPRTNTVDAGTGSSNVATRNRDQESTQSTRPGTRQTRETAVQDKTRAIRKPVSVERKAPNTQDTRSSQEKYRKPKSYESLPSRQPRSSKEFVRTAPAPTQTRENNRSATNTRETVQPRNNSQTGTNTRESATFNRSRPAKTYTQPSTSGTQRSNNNSVRSSGSTTETPSKSYTSPTRSQGTSSKSYSAPSTPSRSSGNSSSSGSSSRSSGSSSSPRGGRR